MGTKQALSSHLKAELGEGHELVAKAVKLEDRLMAANKKIAAVKKLCANNGHVQRVLK